MLTATGTLKLARVNFVCRSCRSGAHPADERLGIEGFTSRQAQRLLSLAGASWSFDKSAEHLQEFCGLVVSDNTIRDVCQRQGARMAQWQRDDAAAHEKFRKATGDVEFTSDGTCVNTWEGWREMRIGIFSKRHRGEAADADSWDTRKLPAPHVRVAFAAIENSERFGSRWGRWRSRLGIRDTSGISVLADGARWIWEEVSMHLAGASETLDIYHALEHVSQTAHTLYGEGAEGAACTERCRNHLLRGGWVRIEAELNQARVQHRKRAQREALERLTNYLGQNQQRLNYPQRLADGQAIGSGQVEGACKHMIGRRLKQTGARWRVRRVNRMAAVCSLLYSDHWDTYWSRN